MDRKKRIFTFIIFVLLYSVVIAGIFYLVGYSTANRRSENHFTQSQTFYATISNIQDNVITVKGMEVNDINFRGNFSFSVDNQTMLTWRYTDISLDDLGVGDNISITFSGIIQETDPARITKVDLIQLLDDDR